jgi:threonine/homoserine/homoserine lactone efflux protein
MGRDRDRYDRRHGHDEIDAAFERFKVVWPPSRRQQALVGAARPLYQERSLLLLIRSAFMEDLFGFLLAGFALAGSPGPNTLSLAATGAAFGVRGGLAYLIGVAIGMVAVMGIIATGVLGILLALPGAMPIVAAISGIYFVYLAFRIATAPPLADTTVARRRPSPVAGIFQSLVNPKAYAAMAALFSGFVLVRDRLALDVAAKIGLGTIIIILVNVAWLVAGAALTRFFHDPTTNRVINVTFAVLLLASVAVALL